MKIVVDARTVRPGRTGVGISAEWLLYALDEIAASHEIIALSLDPSFFSRPLRNISIRQVTFDYEHHPAGEWFLNWTLPRLLREERADIFWGPAFLIPWVKTSCRKVATIHDLAHFLLPECYPWIFGAFLRFATRRSVRSADAIACDSEATRSDVLRTFPREAGKRIEVVNLAADPFFCPAEPGESIAIPEIPGPFILAIGAGTPRKNIEFIVRVFLSLRGRNTISHSLVVVGERNGFHDYPAIHFLPFHKNQDLRRLYRAADLFVFPSLYEGFGIPIIEAMACGCPVAASGGGAVEEVGGNAAVYFPTNDEAAAERILGELLASKSERHKLIQAGLERARKFSWQASATKLLNLFESLAKESGHE